MTRREDPPLDAYGLVGDRRSAALVSRHGSVDWWCPPRFDAPSVFARLLDDRIGGFCSLAPAGAAHGSPVWESSQRYREGTNVLVTTFRGADAALRVTDFMPLPAGGDAAGPPALHRRVGAEGGPVEAELRFAPRFDYARGETDFRERKAGFRAAGDGGERLDLAADAGLPLEVDGRRGEVRARFRVEPGESRWILLRWNAATHRPAADGEPARRLRRTLEGWRGWTRDLDVPGPRADPVRRSALALALLTHEPTGAVVAAPTTSLPAAGGGPPGPDGRRVLLRDLPAALRALEGLGARGQVDLAVGFLERLLSGGAGPDPSPAAVGVDGERPARGPGALEHLRGYRGAHPPRAGGEEPGRAPERLRAALAEAARCWRRRGRLPDRLRQPAARGEAPGPGGVGAEPRRGGSRAADERPAPAAAAFEQAERLARRGRRGEAADSFEAGARRAGPLGLLSGRADPGSGEPMGNYPRSRPHAALINAARALAGDPVPEDQNTK